MMINRLISAGEAAKRTAPVETTLMFDDNAVYIRQKVLIGDRYLACQSIATWSEICDANFPVLEFHIDSGRESLLAQIEGPKSTNPNREHLGAGR